jgi:FtsP/CotA-like multicopper oxidase with cupredoxin domain
MLISLSNLGANDMDGTVGITQTAILPGSEFTYRFEIENDQAGTFW